MTAKKKKGRPERKPKPASDEPQVLEPTTARFLDMALEAAEVLPVRAVVLYADVFPTRPALLEFMDRKKKTDVIFMTREKDTYAQCSDRGAVVVNVPDVRLTRMGQIKMAILLGLSRNLFHIGDRLLCLSGVAGSGVIDTLFSVEVGKEFELLATEEGSDLPAFDADVFERVLAIATSLAHDGREGRPVGTTFVIGDMEELRPFLEQMIFNPFRGYPESDRNMLDPAMEETIREFSAIDVAFVIRRDGVVESAGTFLKSAVLGDKLPRGLGARHQSSAAITAVTRALAVTISESTGNVTVFRGGKILIEVERPRIAGPFHPRRPSESVLSPRPPDEDGSA